MLDKHFTLELSQNHEAVLELSGRHFLNTQTFAELHQVPQHKSRGATPLHAPAWIQVGLLSPVLV